MIAMYAINAVLCALAVTIHYQTFTALSYTNFLRDSEHPRIVLAVFGALAAHIAEIWLFAIAIYCLNIHPEFGQLQGRFDGSFNDSLYFSFSCYTSLGIGDIEPVGPLRFLAGLEAITGLVLISWTASFIFWQMQRSWKQQ